MRKVFLLGAMCAFMSSGAIAADTPPPKAPSKVTASKVDPALEAIHRKEDIKRHRSMVAAHEAAARCLESGRDEVVCNAELARACQGIAYGKYCGMKHPD